ncbi:cell cycle checkpoint control protein RAD9A isoform X2 [Cephus cinctus]|nr:cell cycle checkpoint control protein RAD9A isoform X2 [Cephus cinctus]
MYVHPQEKCISFRSVNMANSAYANFTFHENYFSYYIFGDDDEKDTLKCKISIRSIMAVFKTPNALDKQVETCHIKLQPNASKLIFMLKYKNNITKTYLLPIIDSEMMEAVYNKESISNKLTSHSKVLIDAVQNFQQNLVELTIQITPQKVILRNYIDETCTLSKITRTHLALDLSEFVNYNVETETTITFCMKELRAILNFAESVGLSLGIHFETAGRPVIFTIETTSFEANVVLSTLNPDVTSAIDKSAGGKREQSLQKKAANKKSFKKSANTVNRRTINNSKISTKTGNATSNIQSASIKDNHDVSLINTDSNTLVNMGNGHSENDHVMQNNSERITREVFNYNEKPSTSKSILHRESIDSRNLINSVFSNMPKRKTCNERVDVSDTSDDEDTVPNSPPPAKKARSIFQKCFQKTFDPKIMLPGHDRILAEDSDEHSD